MFSQRLLRSLLDAQKNVAGYFSAASVAVYTYKFTRQNLGINKFIGLFRAGTNRNPTLKTDRNNPIFGTVHPSALCIAGRTRTDQVPPGW